MRRRIGAACAILAAALLAMAAQAQTFTYNTVTNITNYGIVAAGKTGDTIFAQNNTLLTVISGDGVRISGTIRRATISIRCNTAGADTCTATKKARILVGNFATSGRAKPFTEFTALAGANTTISGTTVGGLLDFTMQGWTSNNQTRTFTLDTKMPVAGDDEMLGGTGALTNTYYVYVAKDPTYPSTGGTVGALITVRRALWMEEPPESLRFGIVVKRASGSGTVEIAQATGLRTTGGTSPPLLVAGSSADAQFGRARFVIHGEPGLTLSTTYSPSGTVPMTNQNGGGTISITMLKPSDSTPDIPASGILDLYIGGRITVNSGSVVRGHYQGSFTLTVAYN